MAELADPNDVAYALKENFGRERALKTQRWALEFGRKKITGVLIMAVGMRETWLRNILGGAVLVNGKWVPEPDWRRQDAGALQISKRYHAEALKGLAGVRAGTWYPPVDGATAYDEGMVPMFRDAVSYTLASMGTSLDFARENGVPDRDRQRFAIAAHNAGHGGALSGYRSGNIDANTAGRDYSAWVLDCMGKIDTWINMRPGWIYHPDLG